MSVNDLAIELSFTPFLAPCFQITNWIAHSCTVTTSYNGVLHISSGRQFKEASRIASEVKTIESKMVEVKDQISAAETRLAELNKELTQQSEELEALKNESDAQEMEEGMLSVCRGKNPMCVCVCCTMSTQY